MQRNRLQIQSAIQVHGRDNVLERGDDTLDGGDVLLLERERRRRRRDSRGRRGGTSDGLAAADHRLGLGLCRLLRLLLL